MFLKTMTFSQNRKAFSILESLIMLGLMSVFTMMSIAIFNTGVTGPPESDDSEWSKKGGDQSMATMAPAMVDKVEYKNTYRELPGSMPLEAGKVDTTIITPTPASPNR